MGPPSGRNDVGDGPAIAGDANRDSEKVIQELSQPLSGKLTVAGAGEAGGEKASLRG